MAAWVVVLGLCVLPPDRPRYEFRRNHDPDGIGKFYHGREIARVMGHQAAGWLERPEREQEEQPSKLLDLLAVEAGQVVADVGAGSGYHALLLAARVGERGRVLAVDIQPEMLELIEAKCRRRQIANVRTILGTETDPKLEAASCDLILLVDVYHEFSHPYEMTAAMVRALKDGGRLVLVEFKPDDPQVPIKPLHTLSERQALKELGVFADLKHVKTIERLPWQNVYVFRRTSPNGQQGPSR